MSPHESTAIAELTDEVRGYRRDLEVLTTKLFGDPNNENEHGRLPVLEAAVIAQAKSTALEFEAQGKRIRRQEQLSWMVRGVIGAVVLISAIAYEISSTLKGH